MHPRVSKREELPCSYDCATRISDRCCPDFLRHHSGDYEAPLSDVLHSKESRRNLLPSKRTEPHRT